MDLAPSQVSISKFPGDFSDPVDLDDETGRIARKPDQQRALKPEGVAYRDGHGPFP
jgi:hypothetical protein